MFYHDGIRDVHKAKAPLDETRPIVFIDIDGVVNPIPYEREWVGPTGPLPGMWDAGLYDPKNWQWNELVPDLKKHYPISRQLHLELDNWLEYSPEDIERYFSEEQASKRWKKLSINIMDEMLDELRALIVKHNAQVVYLTFWRSEALRLLEPELKLGGSTYLDWNTHSDRGHRLKIDALAYLYEQADIRNPFIVIDDESTAGLTGKSTKLWYFDSTYAERYPERAKKFNELNSVPKLVLQTDPHWGISRKEIQAIRKSLEFWGS